MKNTFCKMLWGFLALVLVQAACAIPSISIGGNATPTYGPPPEGIYPSAFAIYNKMAVSLPSTFAGGGYPLPLDLNQVQGMETGGEGAKLNVAQQALLSQNGFVVVPPVPGQYPEFSQVYESTRYNATPVFVTTDSV